MNEDQMARDIGAEICQDFERYQRGRYNFETQWREIAQRFIPSHSDLFHSLGNYNTPGEKRTEYIFDSTPVIALGRFASILDTLLTPRSKTWHYLRATDRNLNKSRRVGLWFDEVNQILFEQRYRAEANFASQNNQVYYSMGGYGTGALFVDEASNGAGIRYRNIHLSEFHIVENHQGVIDKCFRYYRMSIANAVREFGKALDQSIIDKAEKSPEEEIFFVNRVQPNPNYEPESFLPDKMRYISVNVCVPTKQAVRVKGYTSFPYPTGRFNQSPGETYGRSPAMEVLPAVKTLNEEKKTVLKQGHRTVDPVLLAHDDGVIDQFSLKPGVINAGGISADGRPLIQPLPIGNIAVGKDLMDDERRVVNDAFLINVFQILTDNPRMTATEVIERTKEKGILLSPMLGRIQNEYLAPLIERELDILSKQGLLPPLPPEIEEAGVDFKIEYDSPLSRAQKAEEAGGLMRTVETALQIAQGTGDISLLDHFDFDKIIPALSEINAVPKAWMKGLDQIQAERQARAQAQQQAMEQENLGGQAAMVNALAKSQQ